MRRGNSEVDREAAKRAQEARALAVAREESFARWMLPLYCIFTCEIAFFILLSGGRWWALLSPVIAACGPRYWKSYGEKVTFYTCVVVIGGIFVGATLINWAVRHH